MTTTQHGSLMHQRLDHLPTLVCLIGPPAVGKTTVGQALCRQTGYLLFHGHIVADVLSPFVPFGTPAFARLSHEWRRSFFEEAARAQLNVVTTVAWRFDMPDDTATIQTWFAPYIAVGRVLCVELAAPLTVRLERNRSESRQRLKNAYWVTDSYLVEMNASHRYDSGGVLPLDLPHLRVETEHVDAEETARRIMAHYGLPSTTNHEPPRRRV